MSEQVPMVSKRLSVSAVLFAIVGGIVGIALGLGLGLLIGGTLAAAFHVSQMEGAVGYFAVSVALIVAVVAVPVSSTRPNPTFSTQMDRRRGSSLKSNHRPDSRSKAWKASSRAVYV